MFTIRHFIGLNTVATYLLFPELVSNEILQLGSPIWGKERSCLVVDFKYIINVCAKCLGEGGREGGREGGGSS